MLSEKEREELRKTYRALLTGSGHLTGVEQLVLRLLDALEATERERDEAWEAVDSRERERDEWDRSEKEAWDWVGEACTALGVKNVFEFKAAGERRAELEREKTELQARERALVEALEVARREMALAFAGEGTDQSLSRAIGAADAALHPSEREEAGDG